MKKPRKLTRNQKEFLENKGLESRNYLVERNTSKKMRFFNRITNEIIEFSKYEMCEGDI